MQYPSIGEYTEALQLGLDRVLADPLLRRGTLRTLGPGQPLVRGGTFALTFEVATDAGRYALRCFHKELDSLAQRYTAIERHLERIDSPCLVKLQFQPQGISTESGAFPTVRMDWAEGSSLSAFVAEHRGDPTTLQQLRQSLRHLAVHLRAIRIAHGDIQPSNVIVQRDGSLCLIDYDGLFVPGLEDLDSPELGQRNFQHPGRRSWHFAAGLDTFSFAVLDLALDALCSRPELWQLTRSGEDAFLLRAADFLDPANSPVFALLAREPGLERRARNLASICVSPFEQMPAFEDFLDGYRIPQASIRFTAGDGARARAAYLSSNPVVNGADFAQCCRHVGDRVEVVGRVAAVVEDVSSTPGSTCLRVDFGEPGVDTVSLRIWPEALPSIDDAARDPWVGQWVSAIGLVEPVASEPEVAQRRKHVSISITEQSQLQRLPEVEAQHRLDSQIEWSGRLDAVDVGVRTEPVPADAEPAPVPVEPEPALTGAAARAPLRPIERDVTPSPVEAAPTPATPAIMKVAEVAEAPEVPEASEVPDVSEVPEVPEVPVAPRVSVELRPARRRRWWPWLAAALVGSLAAYFFASLQAGREQAVPADEAVTVVEPAPAPAAVVADEVLTAQAGSAPATLVFQEVLKPAAATALNTVAGSLRIAPAADGSCQQLAVPGESVVDDLCEDVVELAHRAVYSDREVLTGFTRCSDTTDLCSLPRPFWLELRADTAPALRRITRLWAASGARSITASDAGVQVDLGTWNGERRWVSLTAAGNAVVRRTRVPARPLGRQDCAELTRALDNCATSRDCSSFAASAQRIPAARWALIVRAYHESTGLDGEAFKTLCVRSCEFGFTPSRALIRRYACNGAPAEQWSTTDPAAGLER